MTPTRAGAILDVTAVGAAGEGGCAARLVSAVMRCGGAAASVLVSGESFAVSRAGGDAHPAADLLLLIRAARTLVLESSLWETQAGQALAVKAAAVARAAGRGVALALDGAAGVHRRRGTLLRFLRSDVDVLLCGTLEACALYDMHRVDSAVPLLRRDCRAAILERGARGMILVDGRGVWLLDGVSPAAVLMARQAVVGERDPRHALGPVDMELRNEAR